jgi:hypothetical protein
MKRGPSDLTDPFDSRKRLQGQLMMGNARQMYILLLNGAATMKVCSIRSGFHRSLQLTYISGPGILLHRHEEARFDIKYVQPLTLTDRLQDSRYEQGDILPALAK